MRVEILKAGQSYEATMSVLDPSGAVVARSSEADTNCNVLVYTLSHRMGMAILKPPAPAPAPPPAPPPAATLCDCEDVALVTPCGRYSVFFGCVVAGAGVELAYDSNAYTNAGTTATIELLQLGGRLGVEIPLGESPFAIRGWGEVLYSTPSSQYTYNNDPGLAVDRPDVSAFFGVGVVMVFGKEK